MKSFLNGLLKFWQSTIKALSDAQAQHQRKQEEIALYNRALVLISELFWLISTCPMPHEQYAFCCSDEGQIVWRLLAPNRYEIEIPIRNTEPLSKLVQNLFQKEFLDQFRICMMRLHQQYAGNEGLYFPMLCSIRGIQLYQKQPGYIRLLIVTNGI